MPFLWLLFYFLYLQPHIIGGECDSACVRYWQRAGETRTRGGRQVVFSLEPLLGKISFCSHEHYWLGFNLVVMRLLHDMCPGKRLGKGDGIALCAGLLIRSSSCPLKFYCPFFASCAPLSSPVSLSFFPFHSTGCLPCLNGSNHGTHEGAADVSLIAQQYGGGGHKAAAGMSLPFTDLEQAFLPPTKPAEEVTEKPPVVAPHEQAKKEEAAQKEAKKGGVETKEAKIEVATPGKDALRG